MADRDMTLTWNREINREHRISPNGSPEVLNVFSTELCIGGTSRKFYLRVSGWAMQEFNRAYSNAEDILKECLVAHVETLLHSVGWVPKEGEVRDVTDFELEQQRKARKLNRVSQ